MSENTEFCAQNCNNETYEYYHMAHDSYIACFMRREERNEGGSFNEGGDRDIVKR